MCFFFGGGGGGNFSSKKWCEHLFGMVLCFTLALNFFLFLFYLDGVLQKSAAAAMTAGVGQYFAS